MPKTLKETRMEWEEGLEIQDEHTLDGKTIYVLLKTSGEENYHLHKYFLSSNLNWNVDVKCQNVSLLTCFKKIIRL